MQLCMYHRNSVFLETIEKLLSKMLSEVISLLNMIRIKNDTFITNRKLDFTKKYFRDFQIYRNSSKPLFGQMT